MSSPADTPSEVRARRIWGQYRANCETTGRRPSVLGLAAQLGLTNTTFRRHFPDLAAEISAARTTPADTGADGRPSAYDTLIARNAKLRRANRTLTDQLRLAVAIGRLKTTLAARNARRANPDIGLTTISERVETTVARDALHRCDWIFLAADSHSARHWVNAAVNQYLIPATQIGVKIPVDTGGDIGQIHAVTRLFTPGGGCMWCNQLIDPTELAIDMHPDNERRAVRYLADVAAPSVIALNGLAAMEGVNQFMLAVTGLHHDPADSVSVIHLPRLRERVLQDQRQDPTCSWCSTAGLFGRGDEQLP